MASGFSIDPYLAGQLVSETVSAVQAAGVITSTKVRLPRLGCGAAAKTLRTALHRQRAGDKQESHQRHRVSVIQYRRPDTP